MARWMTLLGLAAALLAGWGVYLFFSSDPVERSASLILFPDDQQIITAGEIIYKENCAACHGADGTGNTALGAPDLTDNSWLYGASAGVIRQSINDGRNGHMPAHRDFLGEDKAHLLATYIYSLSSR